MALAGDTIEDDSGYTDSRIKRPKSQNDSGGGSCHGMGIDHEDYGQIKPFRHFGGTAILGVAIETIVQTHDPFDDRCFLAGCGLAI